MGSETLDQTLTSMAALTFYPAPHTQNGSHACEHHKLDPEGADTLKQGNRCSSPEGPSKDRGATSRAELLTCLCHEILTVAQGK